MFRVSSTLLVSAARRRRESAAANMCAAYEGARRCMAVSASSTSHAALSRLLFRVRLSLAGSSAAPIYHAGRTEASGAHSGARADRADRKRLWDGARRLDADRDVGEWAPLSPARLIVSPLRRPLFYLLFPERSVSPRKRFSLHCFAEMSPIMAVPSRNGVRAPPHGPLSAPRPFG